MISEKLSDEGNIEYRTISTPFDLRDTAHLRVWMLRASATINTFITGGTMYREHNGPLQDV